MIGRIVDRAHKLFVAFQQHTEEEHPSRLGQNSVIYGEVSYESTKECEIVAQEAK